jgi:hypothetical protein
MDGRHRHHRKIYFFALAALAFALGPACSPRISYSVSVVHSDPKFSGRMLSGADIALLPVLSSGGALSGGELAADSMAGLLRESRPDLRFVDYGRFEGGFPASFDRRAVYEFYGLVFREDVLAAKAMDSVWAYMAQPYALACSLSDGAEIRNMDGSVFKHAGVRCELWDRDGREVVWRALCKAVSDDGGVADSRLISESLRRLAEAIPGAVPNYGRESW